jgi:hypothetical protein
MFNSHLVLIVILLGLGACASNPKYVAANTADDYGHYTTRLDENRYRIVYNGGPSTSLNTTRNYAMLRAAELTLQEGYDWFEIVDRETSSNSRGGDTFEPTMGFGYERAYYVESNCGLLACTRTSRPRNYAYMEVTSARHHRPYSETFHSQALEIVMGTGEIPVKGGNYYNASSLAKSLWESM